MIPPLHRLRPGDAVEPFQFLDQGERTGDRKARELEAFLLAFDTGLPPHVGQQVTLTAENIDAALGRYAMLRGRGGADLVTHGLLAGEPRGLFYDRPPLLPPGQEGKFLSDRAGEEYTDDEPLAAIRAGDAVLTFTVVPRGSGERMAIDRDEDGAYDRDELDRRSDPADPEWLPALGPDFTRGDGNGDGEVNIADASFLLEVLFGAQSSLTCRAAGDANADASVNIADASFLLNFLFAGGPAPDVPFPSCGPGGAEGDAELGCEWPPACRD